MKLGVGILGTGWGVRVQVPAFRAAGLEVVALQSRTPGKAERLAAGLGIPFATHEPGELVARDGVDLVSVVTPPSTHAELVLAALEAGRHVVCEKPTARSAVEAARMLGAARAHPDRLSLIDHELRFLPARRELRRLVAEGWAGRVLHVEVVCRSGGRLDRSWPWDWWSRREDGGGALGAVASHMVDQVRYLLGTEVDEVQASLVTGLAERADRDGVLRPVTADERASLHLRLASGAVATVVVSSLAAGPLEHRLLVAGSEGSLRIDDGRLTGHRPGEKLGLELTPEDPLALPDGLPDHEWSRGTLHLAHALRRALAEGDETALEPAATLEDGLAVQRVLDAARASEMLGGWARI